MPELPEVETVMRGLSPALQGHLLNKVLVTRPDLRFPFPKGFSEALTRSRIVKLSRRAKYMLWHFESGDIALMHLGMSGRFTIAKGPPVKHDHVIFETDHGIEIRYNDPRRFGFMDLIKAGTTSKFLNNLGPEPLGNEFSSKYLYGQLRQGKASIKSRLLDQRVVVGVGNIYCSEALFQAGVSPTREARSVTRSEAQKLTISIRDVLNRAIEAGGSSLRDFVQADGELGYFQHAWAVYGREGEPCSSCGYKIKRVVQSSRSSFFCIKCQS